MSVIFQLFGAEDLQRLEHEELENLRQTIITALGSAQALSLRLTEKPQPDPDPPPQVQEALNKRFDEVSHQLQSPHLNPPQPAFVFDTRIQQRNTPSPKEDLILKWALTCEVNNFEFYFPLLQVKKAAYDFFENAMKNKGETVPERLRPKGPDSLYSPFNPRHPLYRLFYDLSKPEANPPQDTPNSSS